MACAGVDESYEFKKEKSRSKQYKPMIPAPKRKKTNQSMRLVRMKTLEDVSRILKSASCTKKSEGK